ncbi:MAG: acetoin utilization deacetylase AcuC-like enzyme [Gammaproteobacteria bacterium]|jgi:acetoin utilization deacetylase AcuC-like enzyme
MTTGYVFHEKYLWHDTGSSGIWMPAQGFIQPEPHVENPESKRRINNLIQVSGLADHLAPIRPRPASNDEILAFHTEDYINSIRKLSQEQGGDAGMTTPFAHGSFEIACLSAGGVIEATNAVIDGKVKNAYALVRPPGHHAEADMGVGFCMLGNVVLAIMQAKATRNLSRIAVVDWDVHHGNGTEHAFYDDPSVLTISVHQDNCFPSNSGNIEDTGTGDGVGYNINVPLPPGSGREAYLAVMNQIVEPALRAFKPELIMVPCGFDAGATDPLGRMMLSSKTYRSMTGTLKSLAEELCDGRLVLSHEGGYSTAYVPFCAHAVIEELLGVEDPIEDPFCQFLENMGGHQLYSHQEAIISRAEKLVADIQ